MVSCVSMLSRLAGVHHYLCHQIRGCVIRLFVLENPSHVDMCFSQNLKDKMYTVGAMASLVNFLFFPFDKIFVAFDFAPIGMVAINPSVKDGNLHRVVTSGLSILF